MKWTRRETVKLILDMEQELNTDNWKTDGIYYWPWFRMQLFSFLVRNLELAEVEGVKTETPNTLAQRFIDSIRQLAKFIRIGRADILFVGAQSHRGVWQGKSYNKFFDPIRLSAEFINLSALAEYSGSTKESAGGARIFSFTDILFLLRFFVAKKKMSPDFAVYRDQVILYLQRRLPDTNTKALVKSVNTYWPLLIRNIRAWKIVLGTLRPKKIITLCYYSQKVYALNAAAAEKGIPVFEMQHGPINPLHLAYGKYETLPQSNSSTLLPASFLVWDKSTQQTLNESFPQKTAVIVGQPWISFLESQVPPMSKKKKIITYAMQPRIAGEFFPSYLLKWIQESSHEYTWWFRLHPRQIDDYDQILAQAQRYLDAGSWEMDQATKLPLPIVLKNTDLVFTFVSGVAIEAAMMGIPVVANHEVAPEYFKQQNKENLVYICSRTDEELSWSELLDKVNNFFVANKSVRVNSYEVMKSILH